MKLVRIVRGMVVGMVSAAPLVLSGCAMESGGDAAPDEDVGQTAEAIGTECAAASPTLVFTGGINYTSPQTYTTSNCYKAVVLDVTNYKTGFPPAPIGEYTFMTTVTWADDTVPSSPTAFNQLWIRADLFEVVSGVPVYKSTHEEFGNCGDPFCLIPPLSLGAYMQAGKTYRVAATARTDNTSSAPTRKVSIQSYWHKDLSQ